MAKHTVSKFSVLKQITLLCENTVCFTTIYLTIFSEPTSGPVSCLYRQWIVLAQISVLR